MYTLTVDGLVGKSLKYHGMAPRTISEANRSSISAFAQREMVDRFMEGVDPIYVNAERGYIRELCAKFAVKVANSLGIKDESIRARVLEELSRIGETLASDFDEKMSHFVRRQFVEPVVNVVSLMQKSELALLAESLVTLTTQKRQFSAEEETVKGPVDVAVDSKGDGFVWIHRKHYFEADLNPQFLVGRQERWAK